jgi:alkanesulfonate monooxygenase SsuD/methylene tetrahydromethanopterin reductase-like flavin-dependent oxidoreductase (luciferase family)
MRIGLTGGGTTADRIVQQAVEAEADGFTSLWYASAVFGDPLVAMALAGRATKTIELGTSRPQTCTRVIPFFKQTGALRLPRRWGALDSLWVSARRTGP